MPLLALLLGPEHAGHGVGLEWLPVLSFVIPIVLLILLLWLGSRNTV